MNTFCTRKAIFKAQIISQQKFFTFVIHGEIISKINICCAWHANKNRGGCTDLEDNSTKLPPQPTVRWQKKSTITAVLS